MASWMTVSHRDGTSEDARLDQPTSAIASGTTPHAAAIRSQGIEAFKDIAFGSVAGILGKYVEYPFDTIKVRLQSQATSPLGHASAPPLHGPLDVFAAAWRSPEGPVRNLYRGISAPLVGAAIETTSLFFSYRIAQELIITLRPSLLRAPPDNPNGKPTLPFSAFLACGAFSGAFTSLLLTPIELIKCKMQVPLPPSHLASALGYQLHRPPTPLRLIRSIFASSGFLGFWHGQLGTLIRETGGSAAWFGSYEGVKIAFARLDRRLDGVEGVKVWQQMVAGACAGVMYNFAFYPADTIKSRMQTEEVRGGGGGGTVDGGNRRTTFWRTGQELWRTAGLRGFYRGCGITVFRAAPSSAIIFSIYEGLRARFG